MFLYIYVLILIPKTTKYNVLSESSLKSSPKNVSMSLNIILYLFSFATNILTISTFIHLYSDY